MKPVDKESLLTIKPTSPVKYVPCSTGQSPPANAVEGGYDNGPSYHARGIVSGKIIPGKVGVDSPRNGSLKGACIPYGSKEHRVHTFEVLTSAWKTSYVRCKTGDPPPKNAVKGGYDGGPSYHAKGVVDGKMIPGKVGVDKECDGNLKGACIAYGGKEHRIHDFEVLVLNDDEIIRVEYKVDEAKMLFTTPKVIAKQTNHNASSISQSMEFSFNETITNSFSFTHQTGVSISVGTKFKCGIPMVGEGEAQVVVTGSYSYSWGTSGSNAKSYVAKFPVMAGPHSTVVCNAVVNETKMDVPYTIYFESGNTSSGLWKGVSTWGLKATFEETKD